MKFVSDANGDHMVEIYSCMGLVMALYVASIISYPHVDWISECWDVSVCDRPCTDTSRAPTCSEIPRIFA